MDIAPLQKTPNKYVQYAIGAVVVAVTWPVFNWLMNNYATPFLDAHGIFYVREAIDATLALSLIAPWCYRKLKAVCS